jgi:hypothetical protein
MNWITTRILEFLGWAKDIKLAAGTPPIELKKAA